jgi:hypothetical protein
LLKGTINRMPVYGVSYGFFPTSIPITPAKMQCRKGAVFFVNDVRRITLALQLVLHLRRTDGLGGRKFVGRQPSALAIRKRKKQREEGET